MPENVIRRLYDVLGYGLELKERIERGEVPRVEIENEKLKALLLADGDVGLQRADGGVLAGELRARGNTQELGSMRFTFSIVRPGGLNDGRRTRSRPHYTVVLSSEPGGSGIRPVKPKDRAERRRRSKPISGLSCLGSVATRRVI